MSYTLLLSGPEPTRAQAAATLRQHGVAVDVDDTHHHGYGQPDVDESWLTATDSGGIDDVAAAVEPLGWRLRAHWARALPLAPAVPPRDPAHDRLVAALRAHGIALPEEI